MQAQEHIPPDRIDSITVNLRPYVKKVARAMAEICPENGEILCDYIFAELTERNIADSTREWRIKVLTWLSKFFQHKKSYKSLSKQDILQYLNTLRKSTDTARSRICSIPYEFDFDFLGKSLRQGT